MRRLTNSLVWKLTIWFLLLSFLPLVVMSIFVRQTVSDTFADVAADETLSQVKLLANEVSASTDDRQIQSTLAGFVDKDRFAFLMGEGGQYLANSGGSEAGGSVQDEFSADVAAVLLRGGEGTLTNPVTGKLIGYSSVAGAFTTAVLIVDGSVVSTPMTRIERSAIVQLAVSLVLIAIAGSAAIWFVFKPIQKLTLAAEQVGAGNLDVQIDPTDMEGELEVLTHSFNQMTRQLREAHDDLEQKVASRTEELRLTQEAERRLAQESALLSQVGQIVSSTLDIDEVYDRFSTETKNLVDFDRMAINIIDEKTGTFVFKYAAGLLRPDRQIPEVMQLANTQTQHVLETGKSLIRGDIATGPRFRRDDASIELGFRSSLMVPLLHQGMVFGTLSLRSSRIDAYGPREQSIVERLADQIAPAIENAELYAQTIEAEEALRVSEERHRTLFEESRDAIFVASHGKLIAVNQASLEIFGFTLEEAIGSDVGDRFFDPADRARFRQEIARTGYVTDFETKLRRYDGTVMDCLITASTRHVADGVVGSEVQGIVRDITEQKAAEETQLQQTKELAVLGERNRMAKEIHDTLAQGFTGIVLQLEAGEQALDESPAEATGHLQRAKSLARESLQEARRSVWNLLPHALEGHSLEEALQEEVNRYAEECPGDTSFSLLGKPSALSSEVQTALLRICQESLTNVKKHAEATQVSVTLVYGPDSVGIDVKDNGKGFDSGMPHETSLQGGFGLNGMEQRATSLGGNLAVRSEKGNGTLVEVRMPR